MNKELLVQYQSIQQEMIELKDRIEQIYSSSLFPKNQQITGMPRSPGYSTDGLLRIFEKIEKLAEFYEEKLSKLNALCRQIEDEIEKLPSLERRIIRLRYLEGKEWSEISKIVGCSRSTLHRLHANLMKDDAPRSVLL